MAAARLVARSSDTCFARSHDVLNVDIVPSAESSGPDSPAPFLAADLTDFGQAFEVLNGGAKRMPVVDAVVHLAAIPSPVHTTPDLVFRIKVASAHAVLWGYIDESDVARSGDLAERGTLLAIDKARTRLGYEPQFIWRELF